MGIQDLTQLSTYVIQDNSLGDVDLKLWMFFIIELWMKKDVQVLIQHSWFFRTS